MNLKDIKKNISEKVYCILSKEFDKLRPCQDKSIRKGLFDGKNLLVCTPTASGKTLIAELAMVKSILSGEGKAVYIVPLKALANEKYNDFKKKYGGMFKIVVSVGNMDRAEPYLSNYDLIITTSEKLDSLIRHHTPWSVNST